MNINQRKKILFKINEQLINNIEISKTAEEIVDEVNKDEIDTKEFAHKIFQEILKNLKITGVDK